MIVVYVWIAVVKDEADMLVSLHLRAKTRMPDNMVIGVNLAWDSHDS